jgi:SAM-dependent methyltransferase
MTGDQAARLAQREQRRATFDQAAHLYDEARPGYPEALFDDLASLSGIPPGGRILEIGCGTGQATLPLARRGYRLLAIELGESLAVVARQKLADYPRVEVRTGAFEAWPVEEAAFDLAVSATAFHWIDPAVAYPKTAQALRPGGALALWWNLHVHTDQDPGFFAAVPEVYQREAPQIVRGDGRPPRAAEATMPVKDEIEQTGLFGAVTVRRYRWDLTYDATRYLQVLDTYSDHRSLDTASREHLFHGIARLIDAEYGGQITKGYLTMLFLARRR